MLDMQKFLRGFVPGSGKI